MPGIYRLVSVNLIFAVVKESGLPALAIRDVISR